MPIYTSQIKGLVAGISVKVNTAASENTGYWIKVARVSTETDYDTSQSVFLFTFPGLDMYTDSRYRNEFILIARYTPTPGAPYVDTDGTMLELSSINANEINGFDPSTDIALLYNNENGDGGAEIWIKIPDRRVNVMVTPLSATVETGSGNDYNNLGFEIVDGATTTNNFQGALPAEHIRNAADNADVDYGTVNGSWTDKIVGSLTLADNVIKASDGGTAITLDTSSNVILSAKLRVPQYIEHNGDTDTRINFSTADKMVFEAGGVEMLSLSETTQNAVIVNDGGADVDFRVEGSSDANAFFVRGSDNNVGIGTNTPSSDLEVYNAGVTEVRITGDNTGDTRLRIDNGTSNHYIFDDQSDSNNLKIEAAAGKALIFNTNAANERIRITSGGLVGIGTDNPGAKLEVNGDVKIFEPTNGSDPYLQIGTSTTECLQIKANIMGGSQELYQVEFASFTASSTADRAQYTFAVDGTTVLTIDDGGLVVNTGTISGDITGNAASADTIDTTATGASANYYLTFVDSSSSTSGETLRVDSGLYYNPSTNNLVITGDLYVRGGQVYGPTDATFELRSDGDMRFYIDDDNDSTAAKFRWYDDTTERMVLDQSGNLQVDGTMTASSFSGTATNATNVNIGDADTASGTHYVNFSAGHGGNGRIYADTSFLWTPSSNTLNVGDASKTNLGTAQIKIGGTTHVGAGPSRNDHASFMHYDMTATAAGSYALLQNHVGATFINAPTGQDISFRTNNADAMTYQAGVLTVPTKIIASRIDHPSGYTGVVGVKGQLAISETGGTASGNGSILFTPTDNQDDGASAVQHFRMDNENSAIIKSDGSIHLLGNGADGSICTFKNADVSAGSKIQIKHGNDIGFQQDDKVISLGAASSNFKVGINQNGGSAAIDIQQNDTASASSGIFLRHTNTTNIWSIWRSGTYLRFEYSTNTGASFANTAHIDPASPPGVIDFTGQHRSLAVDSFTPSESDIGKIVVSSGEYKNLGGGISPTINESLPSVLLARKRNDKRAYGVLSDLEDPESTARSYSSGAWVTSYEKADENDNRLIVNSLGEGAIWVCNINGNLENGDYITSCEVPGYGMRQDDDLLHNYTVAKITQDCDFDLSSTSYDVIEFNHEGQTLRKAFVGCTYHCG